MVFLGARAAHLWWIWLQGSQDDDDMVPVPSGCVNQLLMSVGESCCGAMLVVATYCYFN